MLNWGPGRGIKNGYMLGLERFLDVVINEPEFMEDIFDFWADFLIELVKPVIEDAGVKIDYVFLSIALMIERRDFHILWISRLNQQCIKVYSNI